MYVYPPTGSPAYRLASAGKCYPTRRGGPCLGIVLHITAGLQDLGMDGTDSSAENVAKWAASGNADVSWHVGVDSDSIVPCLPSTYTGWHAKGYNSRTFGIEISKLDVDWSDMPAAWVTATLKNAARALAPIVVEYGLPLALRSKAQVDAAIAADQPFGFAYHSSTSAGTRSDPGKNFPIGRLFDLIRAEINSTSPEEDVMNAAQEQLLRDTLAAVNGLRAEEAARYGVATGRQRHLEALIAGVDDDAPLTPEQIAAAIPAGLAKAVADELGARIVGTPAEPEVAPDVTP